MRLNSTVTLQRQQVGFTLVEVLLATTLLAVLVSIVYGTLYGLDRGRELVKDQAYLQRNASYIVRVLQKDLTAAVNQSLIQDEATEDWTRVDLNVSLRGEDNVQGMQEADRLRFVTSGAGQTVTDARENYGVVEVEYYLERETSSGPNRDSSFSLIRRTIPAAVQNSFLRKQRVRREVLASQLIGLNFRYLRNRGWRDEWNVQRILPQLVEISFALQTDTGRRQAFKTAVAIPVAVN